MIIVIVYSYTPYTSVYLRIHVLAEPMGKTAYHYFLTRAMFLIRQWHPGAGRMNRGERLTSSALLCLKTLP